MVHGISYTLRVMWIRLSQYEVRLTWIRWYVGTLVRINEYMSCGNMLRSTCHVDIPIRLPPARFVSRSVFVLEMVLLFGFENKK